MANELKRLNCNLSYDLYYRLDEYSKRTGIAKSNIVAMALDNYLVQEEFKLTVMERLSDPSELAKVYQMLGGSIDSLKAQK